MSPPPQPKEPSAAQRKLFAKVGYAMPDGSFYIRPLPEGKSDLQNAIDAVGRGEQGGKSGNVIRKHIMKRAAALKLSSEIPDTWNADGSLKESSAEQSSMTLTDFFEHYGIDPVAHGISGIEALKPVAAGPADAEPTSDHDRLMSAAQDHESMAASHMASAAKATQDVTDLQQKGLNAPVARQAFGKDVASQSDATFMIANRKTKSKAIADLSAKRTQAKGDHLQLAAQHKILAQKLKTKASQMAHDGIHFDPRFDIDVYLHHFGVKGMHWGVRKQSGEPSPDHVKAVQLKSKVKESGGVHVLSNDDLKALNERLNLETNYSRLSPEQIGSGQKFANHLLGVGGNVANQQANKYANKAAGAAIDHLISEAARQHASRQRNAPLKVVSVK